MIALRKLTTILMLAALPLLVSGCGIKGDPLVPPAETTAP